MTKLTAEMAKAFRAEAAKHEAHARQLRLIAQMLDGRGRKMLPTKTERTKP